MPRLLQIDSCLGILSTGHITESIGKLATEQGWDCYIGHGARYVGKSSMKSYQVSSKFEEYLHYTHSLLFDRHGLGSVAATKRFIKLIEEKIKPDIIHLHCIHGYYLNYQILFEYLRKITIPVVWTFHDCWSFTGHCSYFDNINCDRWKTMCYACPNRKDYPKAIGFDNSSNNFNRKKRIFNSVENMTIVTVSNWVADLVKSSFLKKKNIQVIYNGIDLSVFKPTPLENKNLTALFKDKFIILAVASHWSERKGFDDFLKMSQLLSDDELIVLVGLSEDLIKKLPSNIIGLERTTCQKELAALYSRADVLVSFSFAETFGLTIVESFACGTPVVVYDNTAPPSFVTNETGFVVEDKKWRVAYDAIKNIKTKGKEFYTDYCISEAKEKYDIKNNFQQYIELYNQLLK